MNVSFDAEAYWIQRRKTYIYESRLLEEYSVKQIDYVVKVVSDLKPKSILELGCGYGRITREIATRLPRATILGIDLSRDQIREARLYCQKNSNAEFQRQNLSDWTISNSFDLVIAIEVFLHLPPWLISTVIPRIFQVAPTLLHDFDREHPQLPLSPHVWAHDYPVLYRERNLRYNVLESGPYSLMLVTQ